MPAHASPGVDGIADIGRALGLRVSTAVEEDGGAARARVVQQGWQEAVEERAAPSRAPGPLPLQLEGRS